MRYSAVHGEGVGVYLYAEPPFALFEPADGWVMLELLVVPYLRRCKGTPGKYLLPAPNGEEDCFSLCPLIAVAAMLGIPERRCQPGTVPALFLLA